MASRRYENFDLLIEEERDGFQARVTACPSNETPTARFVFPLDDTRLENLLLKLDPGRSDVRSGSSDPREAASRELGGALYQALFSGDVREAWIRSRERVEARENGLRLRLKLTDAPTLAGLPWELLYNARLNQYPAQSEATPVVRFLGDQGSGALHVDGPLTILFVLSSPTDLPELDLENEWRAVNIELAPLVARGLVQLERLPQPATPGRLLERLGDSPVHIVHFVGHGDFDEAAREGVVYFCTNHSTKNPLGADRLGSVLQDVRDLKLVVLNACHSARGDANDVFGGMAQGLVRYSVSAVAAMQFPVSDRAASTFSRALYRAIAKGHPVDQAMAGARKSLLMDFPREWATPVLYLRSDDGVLFDLPPVGVVTPATNAPAHVPVAPERVAVAGRRWWKYWWVPAGAALLLVLGIPVTRAVMAYIAARSLGEYTPSAVTSTTTTPSRTAEPAPNVGADLVAGHLTAPPVLDSNGAKDWPVTGSHVQTRAATVNRDGNSALTSDWFLGWDAENLYFIADVTDPTLDPPQAGATDVAFDDVILHLGSPTAVSAFHLNRDDTGLLIFPTGPSSARGDVLTPDSSLSYFLSRGPATGFAASFAKTDHGYFIEGKVPWQTLGMLTPVAGSRFAITLGVTDADKTGIKAIMRDSDKSLGQSSEGSWRSNWRTIRLAA